MDVIQDRIDIERVIPEAQRMRSEALGRYLELGARKVFGAIARLLAPVREWRERAALESELSGMTDGELRDIGLSRCDIGQVVNGSYRDERGQRTRRLRLVSLSGVRRIHADIIKIHPKKKAA